MLERRPQLRLTARPVVASASAVRRHEEVLRVVEVPRVARLNTIDHLHSTYERCVSGNRSGGGTRCKRCSLSHPRLQIKQQSPRDVVVVVGLVEEDVLAVAPIRGKVLQDPILADAVLGAQLLPKLRADCGQRRGSKESGVWARVFGGTHSGCRTGPLGR